MPRPGRGERGPCRRRQRPPRLGLASLALAAGTGWLAGEAQATWSLVAVDPGTRQVGVAGASCIGGVEVLGALVPGRGAVAAQALSSLAGRDRLAELLAEGVAPDAALDRVTRPEFDGWLGIGAARFRQYGVAWLGSAPAVAAFTGRSVLGWAGAASGPHVSVQGNLLAGPEVVARALAAFSGEAAGCSPRLADRLVAGLVAGAAAGGDRRCEPDLAALSAFVEVARPGDGEGVPALRLIRTHPSAPPLDARTVWRELLRPLVGPHRGDRIDSPVWLLRGDYESWRRDRGERACLPQARQPRVAQSPSW